MQTRPFFIQLMCLQIKNRRRQYSFRFECNLFLAAEESDGCERLGQTNSHAYKARAALANCLNAAAEEGGRHKLLAVRSKLKEK